MESTERRGRVAAAPFFLLPAGQVIEHFMGRRRHRDGQRTDKDDPGRQGVQIGSVVLALRVMGDRGCDVDITRMVMMTRLVAMLRLIMMPFLGLATIPVPPVGHGRSTEKRQSHCEYDNRFKEFGQHGVTSFGP